MTPERRTLIESIFESAARLSCSGRVAFLDNACAGDTSLRAELELLLRLEDEAKGFLEYPAGQSESVPGGPREPGVSHPPGTRIGRYEIAGVVGSGGMGEVYRARDMRLKREVALKFIPRGLLHDVSAVERFKREAHAASAVNHPNICTIHDVGDEDGQSYLVMELLQGRTLKARLAEGPLPAGQVADIAQPLASALDAAHSKGIIHRDIKPANVFLSSDGSVKILDFGVAKFLAVPSPRSDAVDAGEQVTHEDTITLPGMFPGTAAYMSPEQIRGGEVDARSDLFSVGVLLYQAATGALPFRGDTLEAIRTAILNDAPVAPRKVNPKIHRKLERVILRAIEKDPALRSQSASHLGADLARSKRWVAGSGRRRWIAISAAAAATVSLGFWMFTPPSPPAVRLRQITTDTENKNWPVVSDGSQIYFLSLPRAGQGRIMRIPVSGGQSTALPIPLPGSHTHLFDLSPDAQEFLMRADDRRFEPGPLWRVRISDGSARRIVPDDILSARYSPEGSRVAWSTGKRLYVGALDGSDAREITPTVEGELTVLSWTSPERITLSCEKNPASVPYGRGWGGFGGASAWQIAPNGSGFRRMLPDWTRSHDFAGFTRDGRFMLVVSSGALWSVPVPGFPAVRWSGDYPNQIALGNTMLLVPHRTRDGRLFTLGDVRLGELQRFDPATHTWQRHLDGISADAVEYSRDGDWVAYVRYPEQSMWRCRADGTRCFQLADAGFGAYLPRWSPDNRTIAFQAQQAGKPWRIWLVDRDGGALRLAAPSFPREQRGATWTADGKRIIFGSGDWPQLSGQSLQILDVESGQVTPMPDTDGLLSPNISADGAHLAAVRRSEPWNQPGLTILDPASRRWKRASEDIAMFPTWARDNRSVIYYEGGEIRRFRLDTWRVETVARFDRYQAIGGNLSREWVGLDHGGAILVMRKLDVRQVYEVESVSK